MNEDSLETLMNALKESVRECHSRMEALPFVDALTSGRLPMQSYVSQLRSMATIHATLEHELGQDGTLDTGSVLHGIPSRLVHLRRDLSTLDRQLIPDLEGAVGHTRSIAAHIRNCRIERPADLLGIIYVLQGMTLGNAAHLPDVLNIFGDETAGTAYYYGGYGDRTAECWQEFRCAMNSIEIGQEEFISIIRTALDFFDRLELLYSSLYPVWNETLIHTAGMLNPEAGDHAVPGDFREIEAAVVAAGRCRGEFPYFDERFQERGRSFARSDAAWLATLGRLPESEALSQVEWLGRVLANRGMPRVTLERQLELLYEELTAAIPENAGTYERLLEAAESIRKERRHYIPEADFSDMTNRFIDATDGEIQGRFRGTGMMVLSAVCDQAAGMAGAVSSLQPWLTDPDRFDESWIETVQDTFRLALESVQNGR